MQLLRTLIFYTVTLLVAVVTIIPCLLLALLPEKIRYDNALYYRFMCMFYKGTLKGMFLPIKIIGREHMPHVPSIIVANHQSALDIPLLGATIKCYPHIWLFKEELLSTPVLGFLGKRYGVVVDTATPRQAAYSLIRALKLFDGKKKRDLIIFPEGGRYIDGEIHEFMGGFSVIAKKTKSPVVPVLIKNAYKVYPPGSFYLRYSPITIIVGKPFMIEEQESDDAFTQRVRTWFLENNKEH